MAHSQLCVQIWGKEVTQQGRQSTAPIYYIGISIVRGIRYVVPSNNRIEAPNSNQKRAFAACGASPVSCSFRPKMVLNVVSQNKAFVTYTSCQPKLGRKLTADRKCEACECSDLFSPSVFRKLCSLPNHHHSGSS